MARRIAIGLVVLLVVLLAGNATTLRAKYVSYQLSTATGDAQAACVEKLATLGEVGRRELLKQLHNTDSHLCELVVKSLKSDRPSVEAMLQAFAYSSEAGQASVLAVLPELFKGADASTQSLAKAAVKAGLQSSPGVKVQAVRCATHPEIGELLAVVPLMSDAEGVVRVAALTAMGTANDTPIGDEELFRWMHDPSADVRHVCAAVLQARGRSLDEIEMGRRLTHPKPHERLQLLMDLAADRDRDIGPWLERLGRDTAPAVRAGAARLAYQRKQLDTTWADVVATSDPDATVRSVAKYHQSAGQR